MVAVEKQIVSPYHQTDRFILFNGDCRSVLPIFAECSIDSIVCDPPYELGFMGKGWDRSGIAYDVSVWRECLRVLKPGGHLLAFGGSRTYHRLACAIEDAGFEIRDQIQWIYGSGFPKSLDVSKAIDAAAGAERERVGSKIELGVWNSKKGQPGQNEGWQRPWMQNPDADAYHVTVPATEAAKQWNGWGTALKPAHEPIVLARKPLIGTVAENVLQHGTGALNIDGCRIEGQPRNPEFRDPQSAGIWGDSDNANLVGYESPAGRWPANVIHDGSDEVLAQFPDVGFSSGGGMKDLRGGLFQGSTNPNITESCGFGDSGSAARFFYCAKASQEDRNEGLEQATPSRAMFAEGTGLRNKRDGTPRNQASTSRNAHPTVKPTELMRYLCRLITPPGGLVLDPFCGSGSTGKAAMLEGLRFVGIELNAEYCELAQRRIEAVTMQGLLFA